MKTKICTRCNKRKPVSKFPPQNDWLKGGTKVTKPHSHCRDCRNKYYMERYRKIVSTPKGKKYWAEKSRVATNKYHAKIRAQYV